MRLISGIFGTERTISRGGEDIRSDYLSADEVARLMKWLKPTTARVCALMLATGLRVSDVVDLPTKSCTFSIDEKYVADNCSVVAVLVDTNTKEVIQAAEIALGEGSKH